MFERLLVAIDDSEQTEVTLSFAGSVARQHGSVVRVCFVNVFQAGSRGIPLLTDEEATDLVVAAIRSMQAQGVTSSGCVHRARYRAVAQRVVAEAESMAADAVIVGSPRPRLLGALFPSAVGERTARLTSLPVLVAPAPLGVPSALESELDGITMVGREREQSLSGDQTLLD